MSVPKGTRVHVEFDGVVKSDVDYLGNTCQLVESDNGDSHYIFIPQWGVSDDVTIVDKPVQEKPKYWPPQQGDIWTLDEHPPVTAYYVYRDDETEELKFMAEGIGYCTYPIHDEADYEKMAWTLLFRNGQPVDIG